MPAAFIPVTQRRADSLASSRPCDSWQPRPHSSPARRRSGTLKAAGSSPARLAGVLRVCSVRARLDGHHLEPGDRGMAAGVWQPAPRERRNGPLAPPRARARQGSATCCSTPQWPAPAQPSRPASSRAQARTIPALTRFVRLAVRSPERYLRCRTAAVPPLVRWRFNCAWVQLAWAMNVPALHSCMLVKVARYDADA